MPAQAPGAALLVPVQGSARVQVPAAVPLPGAALQGGRAARASARPPPLAPRHGEDVARAGAAGAVSRAPRRLLLPRAPRQPRGCPDAVQHGDPVRVGAQPADHLLLAVRPARLLHLQLDGTDDGGRSGDTAASPPSEAGEVLSPRLRWRRSCGLAWSGSRRPRAASRTSARASGTCRRAAVAVAAAAAAAAAAVAAAAAAAAAVVVAVAAAVPGVVPASGRRAV